MLYADRESDTPLYEQIYAAMRQEILSGALKAGDKLPTIRHLSGELTVARNTVDKAYQQLAAEGYVAARQGSGFIVNRIPPVNLPEEADWDRMPVKGKADAPRFDLAYGLVDNSTFPYGQWRKSLNNALLSMESLSGIGYPCGQGESGLRVEIVRYLRKSRGVRCEPSQVVVTCGQQQSMEMLANIFAKTCRRFAMEEPGYDGIRTVFQNRGFQMYPIPVERDGVAIAPIKRLAKTLLYLTPSHQFPRGAVLSIAKRRELLQWAADTDSYLVEDDYDSELRYETAPIPSLQSLDAHGRVIYTGTFSKSLLPAMRTAYIVLPHSLMELFTAYYHRYHTQVAALLQNALADFLAAGYYEKHINRLRTFYRKRQNALLTAISRVFAEKAFVSGAGAGIHILLELDAPLAAAELVERAEKIGIRLYTTTANYMEPERCPKTEIILGFATFPENRHVEVLSALRTAWEME